MLALSVKHDFDRVAATLEQKAAQQVPFAAAKALTNTARDASRDVTDKLGSIFDRPVPFTLRAIGWEKATKQTLTARVFVRPTQAKYLAIEIAGGSRKATGREVWLGQQPGAQGTARALPVDVALNPSGNVPRGRIPRLIESGQAFVGEIHGVRGVWQRTRKGLRLLMAMRPRATYRARFPFARLVKESVERRALINFREAIKSALATAR